MSKAGFLELALDPGVLVGHMSENLCIESIEAWACDVPLERPLDFGRFKLATRSHCVLRIRTADGAVSELIGQTRGAPVDISILDVVGPVILGRDPGDLGAIRSDVFGRLSALEVDGVHGRAWSLLEVALHDLQSLSRAVPLWQSLGGDPTPLPVLLVEGYGYVGESAEAFSERLAARSGEGFDLIKVEAAHYTDAEELLSRLRLFRKLAGEGTKLVLDFAWMWRDVASHKYLLDAVFELGIAWIEDCFPRTEIESYRELRNATSIPIGCGDEATRSSDLAQLIEANVLDVVRLDATTLGGISSVQELAERAQANGVEISFHEHPEVHEHVIRGLDLCNHVELFPSDRTFDIVHKLWESTLDDRVRNGRLVAGSVPGTGIRLIESAVNRYAKRYGKIEFKK